MEPSDHVPPSIPAPPAPFSPWGQPGVPGQYGDNGLRAAHEYVRIATPWWRRAAGPLFAVVVFASSVALIINARSQPDSGHPDEWDHRVAPIATFVSDTRELEWLHPVYVEFMPEAEFVALFDQPSPPAPGTQDERAAQLSAVYNAKGLAVSYDPDADESTVRAVTTLGFYSPGSDRIAVRGNDLTPAVRVVLAHELTHALQAQHFDLTSQRPNDLEFRAIVEADALRVENVYRATLSAAEQQEADAGNILGDDAETALDEVPWALLDQSYAPYVLGPNLVDDVFADRGNDGVDRLISAPPTEEILLNPWLFGTEQPVPTVILTAPPGSISIEPTQRLSPVEMLIILDAWLPFGRARLALEGWGSGSYVSYETTDGVVCFAAKVAFDDGAAATTFRDVVDEWGEAMGSKVFPNLDDDAVEFEACDRGAQAEPTPEPIITPLFAITLEHDAIGIAGTDPSAKEIEGYQCFAATLVDDPIAAPLLAAEDEFTAEQQLVFDTQADLAAAACGVPPLER